MGHPDTAFAQTLKFTANSGMDASTLPISITGPGATASTPVTVSSTGTLGPLTITGMPTGSGGNWLCPTVSGNQLMVNIGGSGCNTSQLQVNQTYNGNVLISDSNGATGNLSVILTVQGSSTGNNGLVASQSPVVFNVPVGSSSSQPQFITVSLNGVAQTITNVSATTTTQLGWLQVANLGSSVQINVNPTALSTGNASDTGMIVVTTQNNGSLTVPVTITVGSGGSARTGGSAYPDVPDRCLAA